MSTQKRFEAPRLDKVPLINLRFDFRTTLSLFRNQRFREQFPHPGNGEIRPIVTDRYTWYGMPNVLLTQILRESLVGLESAVSGAALTEAMDRGDVSPKLMAAIKDPFALKAGGTVEGVYHALPALIEQSFSLKESDPELWDTLKSFYKDVRNPIFHSSQLSDHDPNATWECLELIWRVYQWLNSWHSIENIAGGMIKWSKQTLEDPAFVPVLSDEEARKLFL